MTWTIVVLVVLALVLWSFYVSWRASRLDRLHNRVEAARTALDLALVRRAAAAAELASSGLLDPATSLLLADAVRRVRQVGPAEREDTASAGNPEREPGARAGDTTRDLAESDLTRALRATLGDPDFRGELIGDDSTAKDSKDSTAKESAPDHGAADHGAPDHGAPDHGAAELVAEVEAAAQQVFIARKFYNDLAGRTVYARRRPLARALRLAGSAKLPEFFDMDDAIADDGLE
jgi:hypothetical protein